MMGTPCCHDGNTLKEKGQVLLSNTQQAGHQVVSSFLQYSPWVATPWLCGKTRALDQRRVKPPGPVARVML